MVLEFESKLTTEEVCGIVGVAPPSEQMKPSQFLRQLIKERLYPDAVRFLASAMEPNVAISWACKCAKEIERPAATPDQKSALAATEKWLTERNDANRRVAKNAAELAGLGTPEGSAAMAVFFSGGSIAPKEAPDVPAPAQACQKLAAGAVLFSVVSFQPERGAQRFQKAFELAKSSDT